MRVAILGAGGIGRGYAAFLAHQGHTPVLWSPRQSATTLTADGIIQGIFAVPTLTDCAAALSGADIVILAVPGNAHKTVIDAAAPYLQPDQIVIISSHCSFSALYLSQKLSSRGTTIAAWATTALTAQRRGTNGVHISGLRQNLDVATMPADRITTVMQACVDLFGDRFSVAEDILAISLSNLNPPGHMANFLCNFTRAERGEAWANYGGITPSVARLIEALDIERLALAAAFGLKVRTIHDHFHLSFGVPRGPLAEMAVAVFAKRPELMGPATTDTRFVTEDVPFGLVPLVVLAAATDVKMPLHEAGVALFSALYGRDFRAENDLLADLELNGVHPNAFHARLRNGW